MNHFSDFHSELDAIVEDCRKYVTRGNVANYIPELAKVDVDKLGIYMISKDGECFSGDYDTLFTMQSIVKPLILLLALKDSGVERVRNLVGVEATGKPFDTFNYSDRALKNEHINPMINAGAIALCTLIKGATFGEKTKRLLEFTRTLAKNDAIEIDTAVYLSEKATGNKNRALAYMLNAYNMIDEDVEDLLDCYFNACSIKVNCKDLAHIAYANSPEPSYIPLVERIALTNRASPSLIISLCTACENAYAIWARSLQLTLIEHALK